MDILTQIILLMVMLEIIEANFQRASTFEGMIERLYGYYQRSVFLLFLVHPTFYFVLFIAIYLDIWNFFMIAILALKSLDIFFKVEIIRQRYIREKMDEELQMMMKMRLAPWIYLLGVIIYAPLLAMALFS